MHVHCTHVEVILIFDPLRLKIFFFLLHSAICNSLKRICCFQGLAKSSFVKEYHSACWKTRLKFSCLGSKGKWMKFLLNWSMLLLSNGDSDNIKQNVMLDSNEGLCLWKINVVSLVFGYWLLTLIFQSKLAGKLQSNIIMELLVSFLSFRLTRFD